MSALLRGRALPAAVAAPPAAHPSEGALRIALARPEDEAALERYVASHPSATIYHMPAFARALRRGAGLAVATVVAWRGERPAGLVPVALSRSPLFGIYATSMPFVNYGGILAADPEAARALARAAWAWARLRGARHLVLRHSLDRPLDLPEARTKETLTLALPAGGAQALWKAFGPKVRNLVRKAEREGFVARAVGPGRAGALAAFHAVYSENMRDLGTPSLGACFFRALFEELGPAVEAHVVSRGGRPAAAAITVRFRDRVEVPWAACRAAAKPLAANMLLYFHLIAHAAAEGARVFDFGRSTPGSGPYRFKLQWGARPEPLPWYVLGGEGAGRAVGELSPSNPRFALAIRLWKRLPVGLARVLGAGIARALP